MTSIPYGYSCHCVILNSKRDSADVIKITNQLSLKQGDYLGWPNLTTWTLILKHSFPWLVIEEGRRWNRRGIWWERVSPLLKWGGHRARIRKQFLGAESSSSLTTSKKLRTSVLPLQGGGFCQHPEGGHYLVKPPDEDTARWNLHFSHLGFWAEDPAMPD